MVFDFGHKPGQNRAAVFPPGLVGEMAEFLLAAAPRPVREIALAGALGAMAGIVGRTHNISATGLNLYLLVLAATGTGKEAISAGLGKLAVAVERQAPQVHDILTSNDLTSGAAIYRSFDDCGPSHCTVVSEFGLELRRMANGRGRDSIAARKAILDLFHKSGAGDVLRGHSGARSRLRSPALSILGESTPEAFYAAAAQENAALIDEGLLPRILVVEYAGQRVALAPSPLSAPSPELAAKVARLVRESVAINGADRHGIEVGMSDRARDYLDAFDEHATVQVNASRASSHQLWNRAHLQALRLAALVAVGVDSRNPEVTLEIAEWAVALVIESVTKVKERFDQGGFGENSREARQERYIRKHIRLYTTRPVGFYNDKKGGYSAYIETMQRANVFPFSYIIQRRCASVAYFKSDPLGPSTACRNVLAKMERQGEVRRLMPEELQALGATAEAYEILDLAPDTRPLKRWERENHFRGAVPT